MPLRRAVTLCLWAASLALLPSPEAPAANTRLKPAQARAHARFLAEMKHPLKKAREKCGPAFGLRSDFSRYKETDWVGQSVSSRCEEVLGAVARLCEDPAYKAAVARRIKSVGCVFGGRDGTVASNLRIVKDALVYALHRSHAGLAEGASEYLKGKLRR